MKPKIGDAVRHGKFVSKLVFSYRDLVNHVLSCYTLDELYESSLFPFQTVFQEGHGFPTEEDLDNHREYFLNEYYSNVIAKITPAKTASGKELWFHTEDPRNWGEEGRFHNPDNKLFSK